MGIKNRGDIGLPENYKNKLVSIEAAARLIQSGDHVVIPNEYMGVMPASLVARRNELRNVTVEVCSPLFDPGWLSIIRYTCVVSGKKYEEAHGITPSHTTEEALQSYIEAKVP